MASPTSRESFTRDSVYPQNGHFILFVLASDTLLPVESYYSINVQRVHMRKGRKKEARRASGAAGRRFVWLPRWERWDIIPVFTQVADAATRVAVPVGAPATSTPAMTLFLPT